MDIKNKFLSTQELQSGMIVANDIYKNGTLLIGKGCILTDEIIFRLNTIYFLEEIEIEPTDKVILDTKEEEIKKAEETFKQISQELETLFDRMDDSITSCIEDIRKFSEKIQKEINSTEIIVNTIILKGSGTDCIYRHSVNVATLSGLLGKWSGLDKLKVNLLIYSALLHDFGMTKIDKEILERKRKLFKKEFEEIKKHTKIGYEYVRKLPYLDKAVSYGVLMHHERNDGSGYPLGLKNEKIHIFAKIIAISDCFDAMNSNRIYRKKFSPFEVLEIIKEESLNKLDYKLANIFLEHISNYYIGEYVVLSTGEIAKVLQVNKNNLSKPLLLKEDKFLDLSKNSGITIEKLLLE